MAIDMQQFHQVFFEESLEGLDVMETGLLQLSDGVSPDPELINTIFRAAHSIKGGSGTFGFSDIADFTHVIETLLDEVRDNKRVLDSTAIDLLLRSCDCLRGMVSSLQAGETFDKALAIPFVRAFEELLSSGSPAAIKTPPDNVVAPADSVQSNPQDLLQSAFGSMLEGGTGAAESEALVSQPGEVSSQPAVTTPVWKIHFVPEPQVLMTGNEPARLFRELSAMGPLRVEADVSRIPEFQALTVDECFISWTLWLSADVEKEQILEVFDWVIDECALDISPVSEQPVQQPTPAQPVIASHESVGVETPAATPMPAAAVESVQQELPGGGNKVAAAASASSSIRVGIDKVDSLINLVGELVITQSMLSELGTDFDMSKLDRLASGLEQLVQNTRELQESVMQIRMLPISYAFNRFPRMIRDLSAKTGKLIELHVNGENTELDKTVMEQISDPLVHLVRNAADHGIEMPAERKAAGKPESGNIHLNAFHKGGNIVVEIRDDGRGIDPVKILAKARDRGIVGADQQLAKEEIFDLIFEPGFSTAESVSDISGRGVGMDVVRRNISNLGGRIEIESEPGTGSVFRVHLPLTLAILDGQLVRIGDQTYVVPLVAIVESLQIKKELVNKVSGNMVLYRLREDNVPIIPVYQEFNIDADNKQLDDALLVVVEGDGQKVGLLVDDLLAQQQVVIKSLETNYRRVEGISGATILGDGSVALILDVGGLISRVSRRAKTSQRTRAA